MHPAEVRRARRSSPSTGLFAELSRVARRDPGATAVVGDGDAITFDRLIARSARLGAALHHAHRDTTGRGPVPLSVIADGSVDSVVEMIAVLASGHPLVALDENLPPTRRDRMVRAAGAVPIDPTVAGSPTLALPPEGDGPAVICFTSGSTGDPKGVVFDRAGVADKAADVVAALGLTSSDVVGNVLPISFGAGMTTLLAGLLSGATVVLCDPRRGDVAATVEILRAHRVTTVHSSVSFLRGAVPRDGSAEVIDSVRAVVTYGEPAHASDVVRSRERLAPAATYVNWFAVTECGVVARAQYAPEDPLPDGFLPAGRPVPGRSIEIVGDDGLPRPAGSEGEVVVIGGRHATGYLGRSSDRFGTDASGAARYRTGDLGRLDDSGTLTVLGRLDDAVKIRGYLVEPAEVTALLLGLPTVVDAYVGAVETDGRTELVAYLVTDGSGTDDLAARVRHHAADRLPQWMIPRYVMGMDRLPRTVRGKVDRGALPDPAAPARSRAGTSSSLTMVAVSDIVATVLNGRAVAVHDDLVAAGIDSLGFVSMATRVRERFHVELDLVRLAEAPTMATLAAMIDEATREGVRSRPDTSELVPLRTEGRGVPLFVVTGAGAPAVSLLPLVRHVDPDRPVYGLQARGLESRARPDRTVRAAADRYLAHVRRVQPEGPYLLAGHSMGGVVALEMAARLRELGAGDAHVLVLDTRLTGELVAGVDGAEVAPDADALNAISDEGKLRLGLAAIVRIRLQMLVAGYVVFSPLTQWMLFYNKGLQALRRHTPRPYSGPVTVLRTAENPQDERVWRRIATGSLEILDVPGSHTELLREPFVIGVAEQLERGVAAGPTPSGGCATR